MPPAIITSRALRLKARTIEAAIRHLGICIEIEKAATLALNQFQQRYTRVMINRNPLLRTEETRLIVAKTKAWNDRFAAWRAANPPTLEDVLWVIAKSGFTKEVAPFMNLSKATRECKNIQRVMREVRNKWGRTQLFYFCENGMTASVVRMLEMRNIDVEARLIGVKSGDSCLTMAIYNNRLDICRLLLDKGALINGENWQTDTTIHLAAREGFIEIIRLLCDRGADVEARNIKGCTPLHYAVYCGEISVVKELIEVRNAEINARMNNGLTALRISRDRGKPDIVAYLLSHGGKT
jgi:hypothetical protein